MKPLLRRIPLIGSVPALPLVTNPDAEAAYSLRKLTPSYSGSAVRIRRSSDDAEQDIGFNGLDFDTASAESFCGAGNGFVTTWYDQSGNGNDAIQATASAQPQIVSSGSVITENDKPVVSFTDTDGSLQEYLELSTWHTASDSNIWAFSCYSIGSSQIGNYVFSNDGDSAFISLHTTGVNLRTGTVRSGGTNVYNGSGVLSNSQLYIRSDSADRVNIISYLNGSEDVNGADSNTDFNINPTYYIGNAGGSARQDINISELIFYASDKSSSRTVIEGDMNRYYGVF